MKRTATPLLVLNLKKALTKATITISVIVMLPMMAQKMALLIMVARRIRRGRSALSRDLAASWSAIAFRTIVRSTILLKREISTAIKAASAPSRNAGAAACEITCDN